MLGSRTVNNIKLIAGSYDSDAVAYLTAIAVPNDATVYYSGTAQEITGSEIWNAVNVFFVSAKNNGYFSKIPAMYLFIGGTATAHKFNAFNPIDSDAAHRIIWGGTVTHAATGAKGNGSNGYGDCYIKPSDFAVNSLLIGAYVRVQGTSDGMTAMGSGLKGATTPRCMLIPKHTSYSGFITHCNSYGTDGVVISNYIGNIAGQRTPTNTKIEHYVDGILVHERASTLTATPSTENFNLFCEKNYIRQYFSNAELSAAYIGESLSSSEIAYLHEDLEQLQISLHREYVDADAFNYLTATGITDDSTVYFTSTPQEMTGEQIWINVNKFFKTLKASGDYSKFKVIYPFIGASASLCKWNAVNPTDSNAAFRATFGGSMVYTPIGLQGNGTNAYARSYFYPSTNGTSDSGFIFGLSGNLQSNTYEFGAISGSGGTERHMVSLVRATNDVIGTNYYTQSTSNQYAVANTDSDGIWHELRIGNDVEVLRNNVSFGVQTRTAYTLPTVDFFLLGRNVNGSPSAYSPRLMSFWSTYNGVLTNPTIVYKAFNDFKTAMIK